MYIIDKISFKSGHVVFVHVSSDTQGIFIFDLLTTYFVKHLHTSES